MHLRHHRPKTLAPARFSGVMGWISWAAATLFVFYQLVVQNSYPALDGTLREALGLDVAASSHTPDGFLAQVEIAGDAGDGPQAIFGWGGPSFPVWLGFGEFKRILPP